MNNDENKAEKLLQALSDTEDEMILAADPNGHAKRRLPLWAKIGSAAAVLAVGGVTAAMLINGFSGGLVDPVNNCEKGTLVADENLPKIHVEMKSAGMGFEGIAVPDISDYSGGNPWCEEQNITVMPVYRNRVMKDQGFSVLTDVDSEEIVAEMKSVLIENAAALGVELTAEDIDDNLPTPEEREIIAESYYAAWRKEVPKGYFTPGNISYETDEYIITTDSSFCTRIEFKQPVSIPCTLKTTYREQALEAADYLIKEYSDLLNMENPVAAIDGGDYAIDDSGASQLMFDISVYNASGTVERRIENYFMRYVRFSTNAGGDLRTIHIRRDDLAGELVGNYPLITADEAAEKLMNGEYASSVPVPEDCTIDDYARVELVYRTGITDEYFIPYYKFWVDISDMMDFDGDGKTIKHYGAFYVPAVQPEYIEDIPTYDGRFN